VLVRNADRMQDKERADKGAVFWKSGKAVEPPKKMNVALEPVRILTSS